MSTEGQQKARQYHPLTGMESLLREEKPSLAALREGFAEGWDAAAEHYAARACGENTLTKIYGVLDGFLDSERIVEAVNAMQSAGILFREGEEQ